MKPRFPGPVAVMGAGSVGCFIGGRLQAAGAEVHFVGRARVLGDLAGHGLKLTDPVCGRAVERSSPYQCALA